MIKKPRLSSKLLDKRGLEAWGHLPEESAGRMAHSFTLATRNKISAEDEMVRWPEHCRTTSVFESWSTTHKIPFERESFQCGGLSPHSWVLQPRSPIFLCPMTQHHVRMVFRLCTSMQSVTQATSPRMVTASPAEKKGQRIKWWEERQTPRQVDDQG